VPDERRRHQLLTHRSPPRPPPTIFAQRSCDVSEHGVVVRGGAGDDLEHVPALDDPARLAEAEDAVPAYSGFRARSDGRAGSHHQCR
jgi:hypothetical protein